MLVLDEADRMLDMGFSEDLKKILSKLPSEENRQTLMWTATWSKDVDILSKSYFNSTYVRLNVGPQNLHANSNITQEIVCLNHYEKLDHLSSII